jgi:ABC-type transport system involved in cytochrome bd biosynthesis fused ATPase/permease subunit
LENNRKKIEKKQRKETTMKTIAGAILILVAAIYGMMGLYCLVSAVTANHSHPDKILAFVLRVLSEPDV